MVIVRLIGGLGNQMFQYAAGRGISHRNQSGLKLDISNYEDDPLRSYGLTHFSIFSEFATVDEIASFRGPFSKKIAARIFRSVPKLRNLTSKSVVIERHFDFDPYVLELRGEIYLSGYWNSERYFKDIESIIRTDFVVNSPPDSVGLGIAEQILGTESVSIHVRRGDYVSNAIVNQYHFVLPLEYYYESIRKLNSMVKTPFFFVFSDDPEWTRENLQLNYPIVYVSSMFEGNDAEELRLMSLCKHHIIANSTFSWWGAWLSSNPDKIVIAPRKWFNIPDRDTKDVIPASWIRI
jgi:hypothetical protein